jgi:nucleotide-binding universal stress UspA family protein
MRVYDEAMHETEYELKGMLEKVVEALQADGIEVRKQVMRGSVAPAIMSATSPGDVVVMTSHARSGFTRFVLGSVAEKLVRECEAPVLLVPPIPSMATAPNLAAARAIAVMS